MAGYCDGAEGPSFRARSVVRWRVAAQVKNQAARHYGDANALDADSRSTSRAAAEGARVSDWQPISTAPRDGTDIIVYTIHGDVEITNYFIMTREVYEPTGDGLFSRREETSYEGWNGNTPTHWMPLPEPPK
jgi:hypothetical protein